MSAEGAPRTDHHPLCWGCSLVRDDGLGLDWRIVEGRLEAEHVVPERWQGAPGIVHGGIVAALLDEACGQVARQAVSPAVTARLDVRFLAPVPVEQRLQVRAELIGVDERRATAEATIQDETGMLVAHARGEYAKVRPEHFLQTPQGRARGTSWLPSER